MTYIGVDLAWQSNRNHSGIAVLEGDERCAELTFCNSTATTNYEQTVECILQKATPNTVVAVDAPLIITNDVGQRQCETDISKAFSRFHASAHSSNLTRHSGAMSLRLTDELREQGFSYLTDTHREKASGGRWFFEVYPHPAHVKLFGLERIVRYKKGRVAERRAGLRVLRELYGSLTRGQPTIVPNERLTELLSTNLDELKGKALKRHEDGLDAVICAFLAMYYWVWGASKTKSYGDSATGCIVVPTGRI